MKKIVTLTLSPSLDCTSETDSIFPERKMRCRTPVFSPGGGGINVSRVITRLGGVSTAIYPSGGPTGKHLTQLLSYENITVKPVNSYQWTRQNLNITTYLDHQQYRFVMPGAALSNDELAEIECAILQESEDYLVISGSLPEECDSDFVLSLIEKCSHQNTKIIFDSSGQSLIDVVSAGDVYLIKPNARELAILTNTVFTKAGDLETQARKLIEKNSLSVVLVSLGAQGALLVTEELCEKIIPPKVVTNSTVGAGDSMVGAVAHCLAMGGTTSEAARMGVAAGTAATMNHGTDLCSKEDVVHIYKWLLGQHPLG